MRNTSLHMFALKPAESFLGLSIPVVFGCLLLVHLLVNIMVTCTSNSVTSRIVLGLDISPVMICANAAWCLAGITLIIIGGVGVLFNTPKMVKMYYSYCIATLVLVLAWVMVFVSRGQACDGTEGVEIRAAYACMIADICVFCTMILIVGSLIGALFIVWSMLTLVEHRCHAKMMQYPEPWETAVQMADELAEQEAYERTLKATTGASAAQCRDRPFRAQSPPTAGPFSGFSANGSPNCRR